LLALSKPEVTFLVVIAAAASYFLGASRFSFFTLFHTILGTALLSGGTATWNHFLERRSDAQMKRTMNRPLPSGRLQPAAAWWLGLLLSGGGTLWLWSFVNPLTSLIGGLALLSYLGIYTPLKRRTSACTFIGAFPGAAPALMGWTAATGKIEAEGLYLFLLLLVWQFPHFLAIAWIYREDYQRAGMIMLPPSDTSGEKTFRRILGSTLALLPLSMIPVRTGEASLFYWVPVLLLGAGFLAVAFRSSRGKTRQQAMAVLHASVLYLPLLYSVIILNQLFDSHFRLLP
jgi:protoheme IX farnesyltransferase